MILIVTADQITRTDDTPFEHINVSYIINRSENPSSLADIIHDAHVVVYVDGRRWKTVKSRYAHEFSGETLTGLQDCLAFWLGQLS